jgi:hypothetical protein
MSVISPCVKTTIPEFGLVDLTVLKCPYCKKRLVDGTNICSGCGIHVTAHADRRSVIVPFIRL